MKNKILLLLIFCFVNVVFSQENGLVDCKKVCEKTEIIKENAFLGIKILAVGLNKVKVLEVFSNTAALRHGLRVGDIITKLNGVEVGNHNKLTAKVKAYKPEDVVTLTFERDGIEISQKITLGWLNTRVVTNKVCCDDVAQIALEKSLQIYPVPAKDKLTIDANTLKGDYTIEIYSMTGVLIETYTENTEVSGTTKTINVSRLPANKYFVRVSNNGKVVTKNFVKQD